MIVPVYNVERYINRCIHSVLNQTFDVYELILVDDGSTDQSGVLCDEWAERDKRIHVIHKKNGGLSSARNAGLDVARGEYVTFIDSDDVVHPQYLEYLLELCVAYDADVSLGRLQRFTEDTVPRSLSCQSAKETVRTGLQTLDYFFKKDIEVANYVSACCKLYKRSLFNGIRFPEGRLFEDEFTTYKIYYRASKVVDSEKVLYYYFVNDGGITRNLNLLKYCDEYDAQIEQIYFFKECGLHDLYHLSLRRFLESTKWDLLESRKAVAHPKLKNFQKQYRAVLKMSRECGCVHFLEDYDFFVLAYPERTLIYRIARQLLIRRKGGDE